MYYRQKRSIIEYNNKKTFYVISTERYVVNKLNDYHREYYDKFDRLSRIVNRLYNKLNTYEFKYFRKYKKVRDYRYLKDNIEKLKELEIIKEVYDLLPKSIRLSALYDVSDRWFRYYHRLINSEVNEIDIPNNRRKGKYRFSFTIDPNKITIIDNYDNSGFDIKRYKYLMKLPKDIGNNIIIPVNHINSEIIEVRITPNRQVFNIDIKYKIRRLDTLLYKHLSYNEDYERVAAIDFGIDNLMAIANNIGAKPLLLKGKEIAYINKKYNYLLSLKTNGSKSFIMLKNKRDKLIKEYLDKSVNLLIDYLDVHHIKLLILGISDSLRKSFKTFNKNTDIIYSIDYSYLFKRIEYMCLIRRINVVKVSENNTSKISYFDYNQNNTDARIDKRLYITDKLGVINCDVNSAINIMLKYKPNYMDKLINKLNLKLSKQESLIKEIGLEKFRYIRRNINKYSKLVNDALKINESVKAEVLSPIVIKNILTDKIQNHKFMSSYYIHNNENSNFIENAYSNINKLLYYKNLNFLDKYQKYYY